MALKCHNLFNYRHDEGHLGCFSLGATTNKVSMNIHVYRILHKCIAFSNINVQVCHDCSVCTLKCIFNFKMKPPYCFPGDCTIYISTSNV